MSAHSLTIVKLVEGPDLVEDFRILRMFSTDTGSKEDKVLSLLLGLVAELALITLVQLLFS